MYCRYIVPSYCLYKICWVFVYFCSRYHESGSGQ